MTAESALEAAIIAPPDTVAGLTLRPLTAGTLILLKATGNNLVDGSAATAEREYHVAAFLYIHSADPKTVRRAATNPAAFRDAVLEFADGLSIADFAAAAGQIQTICERATLGTSYQVEGGGSENPNA